MAEPLSKLARQLAKGASTKSGLFGGKTSEFYHEICRCLPFIQRIHMVEEVVSLKDLRRIVKEKFLEFKDVKDARVVDMLIFKGREELETYLLRHKQRHHLITEYAEPYQLSLTAKAKSKLAPQSAFLDSFFTTSYSQTTLKV